MKTIKRVLWWATYITGALIVQQSLPGVDALMPGFLLSLQEKRLQQSAVLCVLFLFIQEGSGSLHFGTGLLWYGGQVVFFLLSRRFFVDDNFLFVFLLSIAFGLYHGLLTGFMCLVQKVPVDLLSLAQKSLLQAAIIPLIWGIAYFVRPKTGEQET
jgi:uncharacterized membrane protein